MESILFAFAVLGMIFFCFIVYKSDKATKNNKNSSENLGIFSFKENKEPRQKKIFKK